MTVTFLMQFSREACSIVTRARVLLASSTDSLGHGDVEDHLMPEIAKEFRSETSLPDTSCLQRVLGSRRSMYGDPGTSCLCSGICWTADRVLGSKTISSSSGVQVALEHPIVVLRPLSLSLSLSLSRSGCSQECITNASPADLLRPSVCLRREGRISGRSTAKMHRLSFAPCVLREFRALGTR